MRNWFAVDEHDLECSRTHCSKQLDRHQRAAEPGPYDSKRAGRA
jgi:hypothetical protein